jgi:hypothetical protein
MNPAEDYILSQPEPFRSILLHLQSVIEHTLPDADLLYKWKVPFYYVGKRPVCFLNKSKDYVDVGFWNAAHLTKHTELMTTTGRKMMKSFRYKSLEEINNNILIDVLQEAYAIKDKKFWK